MINELRAEREKISHAILALEQFAQGQTKGRGRPPAWMAKLTRDEPLKNAEEVRPSNPSICLRRTLEYIADGELHSAASASLIELRRRK